MKLNINNPAYLKIHLLAEGLRLGPSFFNYFDDKYQGSPYHYSKDNTFRVNYPHHMVLKQNTVCAINIDESSPWMLDADNQGFFISKGDEKITTVTFPKKYPWLQEKLTENVIAEDIGFMTTPHSMNVFIGKECFFFNEGVPCKFCGFQRTRKIKDDRDFVTPEMVQKLIQSFLKHDTEINQVYFVGSTSPDFDEGFNTIIKIVAAAKEVSPPHLDLIVTSFPPKDLSLIKKLKDAGATRISFAIEAANPEVFKNLCPGKEKYYGHDNFVKALVTATKHFPRQTYVSIIQGLDRKEDLIRFMWDMVSKGVVPTMNVYYHSPYSFLKNSMKRPSVDYLLSVSREHQKIFAKSNIRLFSYGADRHCMDWEAFRQMI